MNCNLIKGIVLVISAAVIITEFAAALILADFGNPLRHSVQTYGISAKAIVQLPQTESLQASCNTTLQLEFSKNNGSSDYGDADLLTVYLWVPAANDYVPVAYLSDNSNSAATSWTKQMQRNTFIWNPLMLNVFRVEDGELEVWINGNIVTCKLAKPIHISLPFDHLKAASCEEWGDLTFNLPQMTLTFTGYGESVYTEINKSFLPNPPYSGWICKIVGMRKKAHVNFICQTNTGRTTESASEIAGLILSDSYSTYKLP